MADNSRQLGEKLAGYLHSLPAHTLVQLVHELDGVTISSDLDPANAMILEAARKALCAHGNWGEIAAWPERMAFTDAELFRIGVHTQEKHRGRIADDSLRNIWVALVRNGENNEISAEIRDLARTIADEPAMLEKHTTELRAGMAQRLSDLYRDMVSEGIHGRRASAQIGGLRSIEDLADLIAIMAMGDRLDAFKRRIRDRIDHLDEKTQVAIDAALEPFSREELTYPLIVLLGQMTNPGSLVNLLVMAEGTDDPTRLVRARYAPVVDVLLNELDILAMIVAESMLSWDVREGALPAVRRFHEIGSSLAFAIDMETASDWSQRLIGKRRRIADTLREPLEKTVAQLRLGIQPNGAGIVPPDPLDTEQAIASAQLLMAIKPLRSELALNECVSRVHTAVESFFDTAARSLPQQARQADIGDMPALNARFDALYRTSIVLFGDEYAALLRRSGEVAGLRLPDDATSVAA
ncbi:MAG: hypothetical protein KDJ55_13100 [Rhodobiaceae bacterium]|nr:hypothetical protein [Rhodobiaceae bacterium]MCC0012887.1 hypothetical protein [Rhodobiaceae bacterium]MCC0019139.1 hypothetical protein [Rhodobiaceae bacterium]MCC0051067.1 hypothetical protein [Rhodobiaceae bacterium]MCC0060086.1 hypothetical protein [Rhodobiaceae bacterium]